MVIAGQVVYRMTSQQYTRRFIGLSNGLPV